MNYKTPLRTGAVQVRKQIFMRKIFTLLLIAFSISNLCAANAGDTITLDLSKSIHPASFTYTPEGYWTETYNDEDYTWIGFDNFSFSHLIDGAGSSYGGFSWDGFTVCNSGDSAFYIGDYGWDYTQQWGNMAGGGIKTDENGNVLKDENGKVLVEQGIPYLVGYYSVYTSSYSLQTIFPDSVPYQAVGVYIDANPWVYYDVLYGEGGARALNEEGDYFKLLIHGLDKNYKDNGKVVEYALAEFKDGVLQLSPDWQWVDLSSLGEVYGFYYTIESTDVGAYGINTATYFCMDKLQVSKITNDTKINEVKTSIAVYPNPFTDYIDVNTTAADIATVYTLSGNVLLNVNLKSGSNRINTSALPKGIYLLKFNENTIKIVK